MLESLQAVMGEITLLLAATITLQINAWTDRQTVTAVTLSRTMVEGVEGVSTGQVPR